MKLEFPSIKNIIAVVSGKGGVGKSTIAFTLANLLVKDGLKVGLLDGDIYGPSVPKLMGIEDKPKIQDKKFVPLEKDGLKAMSMGFLLEKTNPVVWRGPMVQTAVKQLFQDVAWGDLDWLVVDMPPGTGDAHLTLAQSIPLMGVIVITTPQELAAQDAAKCLEMYRMLKIPILGVVDNMKGVACPCCQENFEIFPGRGGEDLAEHFQVPYLGAVPLDPGMGAVEKIKNHLFGYKT
ncbi:MAG: Mrp/NBP35 family ATP-binding protein [Alphaproteobacteria bacterium]